jgi:hypothetical protein
MSGVNRWKMEDWTDGWMDGLTNILVLGFTGLKINYTEVNYHADVITLQGLSSLEKSKLKTALFSTSRCNILNYL